MLNIREASLSSDLLEGLLDLSSPRHLFFHLGLQKCTPELLGQEVFIHFELIGVLVVVGCLISDLLLAGISLDASLKGRLLVVKGLQYGSESVLPLKVVLVNQPHKFLKSMLGLEPFLLSLPVFVSFLLVNLLFVLEAFLRFVEANLNGNKISLHAVYHLFILALDHKLVVMRVFYFI